ncbi:hypothetical protein [Lysobacter terrae]
MCHVQTYYPRLRESLAPEFIEMPDASMDAIVAEVYGPGVTADMAESFWNDIGHGFQNVAQGAGRFAQQAAPQLQRALPGVVQGATAGSALGPWGMLAGAVAGGAGSILSQQRDPTLRNIGGAIGGVTQLAGGLTGGGGALGNIAGGLLGGAGRAPAARAAPGASPAGGPPMPQGASANALLGLLSRPETLQALASAAMGRFGRGQVPVGQQTVPVQSILSAIGMLAGHASHEAEQETARYPDFYYGSEGELAIDVADAEQRAFALLELYANTPSPWRDMTSDTWESEGEYTDQDAAFDAWLMANEWSQEGFHA